MNKKIRELQGTIEMEARCVSTWLTVKKNLQKDMDAPLRSLKEQLDIHEKVKVLTDVIYSTECKIYTLKKQLLELKLSE